MNALSPRVVPMWLRRGCWRSRSSPGMAFHGSQPFLLREICGHEFPCRWGCSAVGFRAHISLLLSLLGLFYEIEGLCPGFKLGGKGITERIFVSVPPSGKAVNVSVFSLLLLVYFPFLHFAFSFWGYFLPPHEYVSLQDLPCGQCRQWILPYIAFQGLHTP